LSKQIVANIQSRIVTVGREALSENADWLITHRTRKSKKPAEVFSLGGLFTLFL
jgi:hypothetical protein